MIKIVATEVISHYFPFWGAIINGSGAGWHCPVVLCFLKEEKSQVF